MATSSSPRPEPTSSSTGKRSRRSFTSCRLYSRNNDRPTKRPDNGRLSGTSVGECSTACAWRGTSMRRPARPHVRCRQRRLHEHVAASTSGRQPLAWTLAVTQSEHPAGRDNRTFGAADSERPIAASVSRVAARRSPCSWVSLKIIKDFALPSRSLFLGTWRTWGGANVDAAEVAGQRAYGLGRLVVSC